MQIQISWLLQEPTNLDLHCLQRPGSVHPGSAGLGLNSGKKSEAEYPHLAKLANKYLAIHFQASSAAVERQFSIGGKVFRLDRCKLKDETFERLMMMKYNSHLNEVSKSITVEKFEELVKDSV